MKHLFHKETYLRVFYVVSLVLISRMTIAENATFLIPNSTSGDPVPTRMAITFNRTTINAQFTENIHPNSIDPMDPYSIALNTLASYVNNNEDQYLSVSLSQGTSAEEREQALKMFSLYRQVGYSQATAVNIRASYRLGKTLYYDILLTFAGGESKRDVLLVAPNLQQYRHARDLMMESICQILYKVLEHERKTSSSLEVNPADFSFGTSALISNCLGFGADPDDPVFQYTGGIIQDGKEIFGGNSGLEFNPATHLAGDPFFAELVFFRETWRLLSIVPEAVGYLSSPEFVAFLSRFDAKSRENITTRLKNTPASISAFKRSWLKNLTVEAIVNAEPHFFVFTKHGLASPIAITTLSRSTEDQFTIINHGSRSAVDSFLNLPPVIHSILGSAQ